MKVLVNAVSARQGGILTYTRNLMRSLKERKVDAVFAVPQGFEPVDGCPMLPMAGANYRGSARLIWDQIVWRSEVMRRRPDVLFSSANFGLLYAPVPQILLLREGGLFDPMYLANFAPTQGLTLAILRKFRRQLMLLSAKNADLVVTPTESVRTSILQWLPELANRCTANSYGTLEHTFVPGERRPWRADGRLRALFVSVYYVHKNLRPLLRAMHQMAAQGDDVHVRITMTEEEVRATPGGEADAMTLERAQAAGLVTLGRHPYAELPGLYRDHDVFVFPSVAETFGHPMAEALASGLPLVVADHPVNREICGDAALYFSPFSPSELVARLHELDASPRLREDLVRKGRERVLSMYTWDAHVDRMVELFDRVATKGMGR